MTPAWHAAVAAAAPVAALAAALLAVAALAATARAAPLAIGTGPGVARQPFAVYGAARDEVLAVRVPGSFEAAVEIPPGARLLGAVAVPDRVWTTDVTATAQPLRFRVVLESGGETLVLYEREVDIAARPPDRRWLDFGRDLSTLAGRRGRLRFETAPARPGAPGGTLALWAPPELLACARPGPSLLLVTIDALRADRLGSAGYPRPTTPHLDAFAARATRFTAAFAAAPKTIPSIPQTLTGSYFFGHRVTAGLGSLLGPGRFETSRAIVNNPYVATWLGGERPGFGATIAGDLDARAITSEALRFLSAAGRCPTALYLHYLDPHTPYEPPPRYARLFVDRAAPTAIGLAFADVAGVWEGTYGAPADRRRIVDLYDGAIAWTDRQLGRLFRGLARRGRLRDTIVVVTADHGEELWERGGFFHGQSLYDELLHVPLVMRLPGAGHGRRVDAVVSTVDLVATIAEAAGFSPPAGDGASLVPLAAGTAGAEAEARTVFATVSYAEPRTPPRQAVRRHAGKLIRNVEDGTVEVYDLARDPEERRDLGPDAPLARELAPALDAVRLRIAALGWQLRLRSAADRPVAYAVTLAGAPPVPIVDPDRLTLEPGDRILVGPRAATLTVRGTLTPGDEDHVRMDVLATAGRLAVTIALDGAPAPAGTLRLGARGTPAGAEIDLADPELLGEPGDAAGGAAGGGASPVTVSLWRAPTDTAGAPPPLDPATRERLRQLGYVD